MCWGPYTRVAVERTPDTVEEVPTNTVKISDTGTSVMSLPNTLLPVTLRVSVRQNPLDPGNTGPVPPVGPLPTSTGIVYHNT